MQIFKLENFTFDQPHPVSLSDIIRRANAVHDKWLKENTVRVTCKITNGLWSQSSNTYDTHEALIIKSSIKEIEKAECEHTVAMHNLNDKGWEIPSKYMMCGSCGKKLKPTGWELADEA